MRIDHVASAHAVLDGGAFPFPVADLPVNLPELLTRACARGPDPRALVCVSSDGTIRTGSYGGLRSRAGQVLAGLRSTSPPPGDHVLLQATDPGRLLTALWATLLGGFVPVLLAPAAGMVDRRARRRFRDVWHRLDEPTVLAERGLAGALRGLMREESTRSGSVVILEDCSAKEPDWSPAPVDPDSVALLLPTSGSTASPKLVRITHRNAIASLVGSAWVNGYDSQDVSLNWLPLYHVGGLMRTLRETHLGCRQIQMSTALVRADPLVWLDAINEHRVTLTWAPTTAFAHLLARLRETTSLPAWDLGCLRSLYTSGESVAAGTMEAFLSACRPFGLEAEAMHVAWGMTEACFATYSHTYLEDRRAARASVADVGRPIPGVRLRVVDDGDRPVEVGRVGRLQIAGPVVCSGYQDEADTEALSTADGWLRTGDLGRIQGGRLTVVGRESDLLNLGGVNFAPAEIEEVAAPGGDGVAAMVAACAVHPPDEDVEALAIFYQSSGTDGEEEGFVHEVRSRVAEGIGATPRFVLPMQRALAADGIGKVDRRALCEAFSAGSYDEWRCWPYDLRATLRVAWGYGVLGRRGEALATRIAEVFAELLQVERVDPEANLFGVGGTSLVAVQAAVRLSDLAPGRPVAPIDLFRAPTPRLLAGLLTQGRVHSAAGTGRAVGADRLARRSGILRRAAARRDDQGEDEHA